MNRDTETIRRQWLQLAPERAKRNASLTKRFMLEFNYNSNHIEGNTLTYGQTELLLLFGKVTGEAKMKDLEEMKAHNVALRMVMEDAARTEEVLSETYIRQLHTLLLREDYEVYQALPAGLPTSYTIHAGTYKTRPNSVVTPTGEHFDYASPEETPALMNDLIEWYRHTLASGALDPIECASLFHYRYIRIHPFEDGNGRMARLLMNYILCRQGCPMVVVPSERKEAYLSALHLADIRVGLVPSDGAHATIEQIRPFTDYIEQLVRTAMQEDIALVTDNQDKQWWYNGAMVKLGNDNVRSIIEILSQTPSATVRGLSKEIGINPSAIQRHLKTLQEKGYLVRIGGKKGTWHVMLNRL